MGCAHPPTGNRELRGRDECRARGHQLLRRKVARASSGADRAEPELLSTAIEEFLRFYSPVTMARYVTEDLEFNGCPMRRGDKVPMAFPAGNHDPAVFDDPDDFRIDRLHNRHFAFGSGIHRCLGSNLARMELRVAIEECLRRVPAFELADPTAVAWTGGQVRGPRRVPVRW